MSKKVVILVGLPGSGKSSAGEYFKEKNIPVVRMGSLTEKFLQNNNLIQSEINERKIREGLRQKFGLDIYAREILSDIKKNLDKNSLIIIDGMRSPQEWIFLSKNLENPAIVYLESNKEIRIKRLKKRSVRPLTLNEIRFREDYEVNKLKIKDLKKFAMVIIKNNLNQKEFYLKLKKVIADFS